MADTIRQFLDLEGLKKYDENIKVVIDTKEDAGTAATLVGELAEGQVKTNKEAIAAMQDENTGILKAAKDYTDAEAKKVQDAVDAIEVDMGEVDGLSTSNKTVVGAINEVLAAVGAGGTAAAVTMTSESTTEGMLKSYTIKQGDAVVGTIDIPKDMVVESGEVVEDPAGMAAGTYIKLVLANVAEPLYINVAKLIDVYTAQANAAQVQVAINGGVVSAAIVAGSIGSVELADGAVLTAKIADANVTKAKLSTAVQASLDKADAAAEDAQAKADAAQSAAEAKAAELVKGLKEGDVATNAGNISGLAGRMDAAEGAISGLQGKVDTTGTVSAAIAAAKSGAEATAAADATAKANAAEAAAKAEVTALQNGQVKTNKEAIEGLQTALGEETARATKAEEDLDKRVDDLEAAMGTTGSVATAIGTAKQEAIDAAAADAKSKADQALVDAKKYADDEDAKIEESITALEAAVKTDASNKDAVVLAEAQKGITAVQAIADANTAAIAAIGRIDEADITALFA